MKMLGWGDYSLRTNADMVAAFLDGKTTKARELHFKMLALVKAMFIETNPIPVKTAMGMMGLCDPRKPSSRRLDLIPAASSAVSASVSCPPESRVRRR